MGCNNSKQGKTDKPITNEPTLRMKKENKTDTKEKVYEVKICLLGDVAVGKTSIASRFCKNSFSETYVNTIGGAYQQQTILLDNGAKIKFHVWDTTGDERFKSMTNLYYRDAQVAILTYDVTKMDTFQGLEYWIKVLSEKVNKDNMLLFLAGNKSDMPNKVVATSMAKEYAEKNNMYFFETSAKTGAGVKELFKTIANKEYEILIKK